jgi:LacI family repressor for deo operon, udp, cdd, tsx, nupC, and nupG
MTTPSTDHLAPSGRTATSPNRLAVVAQMAGVSEATVSRVLNRRQGVRTSTRQAVEEALLQTDYEPRVPTLVLVMTPGLTNQFCATLAEKVASQLGARGIRVLVGCVPDSARERDYVESMIDGDLAAVVFLSASNTLRNGDRSARDLLRSRGVPYVAVNGGFDDDTQPVFSSDDRLAATLAVEHLVGLGHQRIGMCAGPFDNKPSDLRVAGFRAACAALELDPAWTPIVHQPFHVEGGREATRKLLSLGVTAVVAASDDMALGAIEAVQARGLSVPHDVSVIGYDDAAYLDHTNPPLTTIAQPISALASKTVAAVLALLDRQEVPSGETAIAPTLHLRGSTGPAPAGRL